MHKLATILIGLLLIIGNITPSHGEEPRRPGHHRTYRHTYSTVAVVLE
jgi:hypothetical protein